MPLDISTKFPWYYESKEATLFHAIRQEACLTVTISEELEQKIDRHLDDLLLYTEDFVDSDSIFYRARLHELDQNEKFSLDQMGAPPGNKTNQGRIQPKGQRVLYTATDVDTAIAELRPATGSLLTVGEFRLNKGDRLRIFNLTKHQPFAECFTASAIDQNLWEKICRSMRFSQREFSRQVHTDTTGRYLDTIYISQRIQKIGFDGVAYKSLLNEDGVNYAFFAHEKLSCTEASTYKVTSVLVKSQKQDKP